jgi:hypothetical protein
MMTAKKKNDEKPIIMPVPCEAFVEAEAGEKTSTGRKSPRYKLKDAVPDFIGKFELARHLGVRPQTIDKWVHVTRTFPPPHSQPGSRYAVWLRRHYQVYRDTGRWPEEAYHFGTE